MTRKKKCPVPVWVPSLAICWDSRGGPDSFLLYSAVEVAMKRILFLTIVLLTLFGCAPTSTSPAPKEAAPEVPAQPEPATAPAPTTLSMNYINAATALSADDLEKAKASLTALAMESTGDLKT